MTGSELIGVERIKQADADGWTFDHDDLHTHTELATAAMCYAVFASAQVRQQPLAPFTIESRWPFEWAAWRPSDVPERNLVKAGALIAAEIDRLQRRNNVAV